VVAALFTVLTASTAGAVPRTVLGRWPDAVTDERLAELEAAARADGASAVAWNDLALAYGGRQQWRRCLEAGKRAVARDPELVAARVSVAGAYLNSERPRQAVAAAGGAVDVGPEDPGGYYILGWANHKLARSEEAIAALESCVRLGPKDPWSSYALAVAYSGAQNFHRTEQQLESALALDPPAELAASAKTLLDQIRAVSSVVLGSYLRAVDRKPQAPSAHLMLADAALRFGYDERALESAARAIELLRATGAQQEQQAGQRNTMAEALRIRGIAFVGIGRWHDGAEALVQSGALVPGDARVYYNLGLARLGENKPADAVPLLEKAVSLAPAERGSRLALIEAYGATGKEGLAERERERLESL